MSDSMEFMQEESREILQDTGPESVSHTDSAIPRMNRQSHPLPRRIRIMGSLWRRHWKTAPKTWKMDRILNRIRKLQSSRQRPRRKAGKRGRPGEKNLSLKQRNPSQP